MDPGDISPDRGLGRRYSDVTCGHARFRRYSPGGLWWFLITLLIFLGWNWMALWLVDLTGLAASHPRLDWVIGEVVGVFPLLFTITLLTLKLRRLRSYKTDR
jgi:hypothetical protein